PPVQDAHRDCRSKATPRKQSTAAGFAGGGPVAKMAPAERFAGRARGQGGTMRNRAVVGSLCLAFTCIGGNALADANVEPVIVPAERRAEPALNVPLSVTALSGASIRENRIDNALDLQNFAPSLTVVGNLGSSDDAVFSIRGQNQPFGGAD